MTTTTANPAPGEHGLDLEIDVDRDRRGAFEAKVRELEPRFPGIVATLTNDPMAGRSALDFLPDPPPRCVTYTVRVPYPVYRVGDFRLFGIISDRDGKRTVWVEEDGAFSREDVEGADFLRCDHCGTRRHRKALLFFANEKDGSRVQIGTTCSRDYFGVDVERELSKFWADVRREFGDVGESFGGGGTGPRDPSAEFIVPIAIAVIERHGYVSKKQADAEDRESTAGTMAWYLDARWFESYATASDRAKRDELFASIRARYDSLLAEFNAYAETVRQELERRWTEFQHNVVQNFGRASYGMAAFIASDIVRRRAAANRNGNGNGRPASKALAAEVSTKMADLGEFEVVFVREEDGDWGASFFHVGKQADGTTVFFRKSKDALNVGDVIALRGKVKRHLDDATVVGYARTKLVRPAPGTSTE